MSSEQYVNISQVSVATGVPAVTLRAWERRYNLITPKRTTKGHRLYSNQDINQIHQIVNWLNRGITISKVATLLAASDQPKAESTDEIWQQNQTKLFNSVTKLEQNSLYQQLDKLNKSMPFISLCEQIYQPIHHHLFQRWQQQPLGHELEQQIWSQAWQRQITLMQLRAEKQKPTSALWLVNLDRIEHTLNYWLAFGLLLQSGARVHSINQLSQLSELNRVSTKQPYSLMIYGDHALSRPIINQLNKLAHHWQGNIIVAGHIADIHKPELSLLDITTTSGEVSTWWNKKEWRKALVMFESSS